MIREVSNEQRSEKDAIKEIVRRKSIWFSGEKVRHVAWDVSYEPLYSDFVSKIGTKNLPRLYSTKEVSGLGGKVCNLT